MGVYGDPILIQDRFQTKYLIHLAQGKNKTRPEWFDQLVIQKKESTSSKWTDGSGTGINGKMQDKPSGCLDESPTSPYRGSIYLAWTEFDKYESKSPNDSSRIQFAASRNEGEDWTQPTTVSDISGDCSDRDATAQGASLAVDPKGIIHLAWARNGSVYTDRSSDGGKTWGIDREILSGTDGWVLTLPKLYRANGMPFLRIDSSGVQYLTLAYSMEGRNKVVVLQSEDNGISWSEPHPLQTDSTQDYFMPISCIDAKTNILYNLYYALQKDTLRVLLSYKFPKENRFKTIQINEAPVMIHQGVFLGDYLGLHASNGIVAMAYTVDDGKHTQLKTRILKIEKKFGN